MQSSSKGYLFLLLVLGVSLLSAWQYRETKYNYGLDVQGGVRLSYRVKDLKPEQKAELPRIMSDLVRVMTDRGAATLGVVESTVIQKGDDEIIVELPGFTDVASAKETMQSTASIKVYHARTVETERNTLRPYREDTRSDDPMRPEEYFVSRARPTEVLKPGMPEYVNMIKSWFLILEGDELKKAYAEVMASTTTPTFEFSSSGAKKLESWSRMYRGQGEKIAFVLDNRVLNIAAVQPDAILSDRAILTGKFDPAYVNNLVRLLNAGALPVTLEQTSSQSVDPTIGKFALEQIVRAGMISFAIIALFLIVYYSFPGFVALIALCLYVLFTLTVLKLIGATFSLAAIAGFILSVGMAVDANILVFERMKEEMRDGRTLLTAVELGFKRALTAIIDSNVCTILTSIVLIYLGTGPVKGFATTLIVGVAISLFTAVFVTRSLLVFIVASGLVKDPKKFALDRQWFGEGMEENAHEKQLKVVEKSKKWFLISLATMAFGVPFFFMGGLKANVEFQGGFEATYKTADGATAAQITKSLEAAGFKGSNVKLVTGEKGEKFASVTVPSSASLKANDPTAYDTILKAAGPVTAMEVPSITSIGPSVQQETIRNAILAILISSTLIVAYLTLRFGAAVGGLKNGIKFGLSAIGALVHDICVVIGVGAVLGYFLGWEISALQITAMLTVIGFSVHDTIVVFDRIRENLRRPLKEEDFRMLCNRSITQSFARSINTSLTVVVTLAILIFWGAATPDLKFFCAAMFVGILSGTYSSIYNATPILYLWDKATERKRGYDATLIAEANAESARLRSLALQTEVATANSAPAPKASTPGATGSASTRGYGQVRRKERPQDKAEHEID